MPTPNETPRLHLPCPACGQKVALAVWPVVKFACLDESLQWDVAGDAEPFEGELWSP